MEELREYFNLCKMLLTKAGSYTYSFAKVGNTISTMRDVIQSQEKKIAELEQQLNDRDTDRDRAFDEMYSRAIKAEQRVVELEEENETLKTRCDKFLELNLLQKK